VISIVLLGAAGRMGRAVARAAAESQGFRIKARVDRAECMPSAAARDPGEHWSHSLESSVAAGDVVVDFSAGPATRAAARVCAERGVALVSGTTGIDRETEDEIRTAAERVAVLRAANFSLGVAALRRALAETLQALPDTWDIEIVEKHHRGKIDSPSGTALLLARDAAESRGWDQTGLRSGREGRVGPRPAAEIGLHAVRGGTWVGDHTVLLAGEGEWIELRHVASDRQAFAHGALAAARFIATSSPGLYTIDDVLNPHR
jgi:4-hydroxy-tetrahydrodipicolinate reductase